MSIRLGDLIIATTISRTFLPLYFAVLVAVICWVLIRGRRQQRYYNLLRNPLLYGIITNALFLTSIFFFPHIPPHAIINAVYVGLAWPFVWTALDVTAWFFLSQWRNQLQPSIKDILFWRWVMILEHITLLLVIVDFVLHVSLN
jgi:hypothetical protein